MSHKRSTALVSAVAGKMPYSVAQGNGRIKAYSGAQPAGGSDKAPTGTLLNVYTLDGNAFTGEVRATILIGLSGSAGSIDTLTVGGAIPLIDAAVSAGSLALLADALAAAINAKQQYPDFDAVSDGVSLVTISGPIGLGAGCNGLTLEHTETTTVVAINGGSSAVFGGAGATAGVTTVNGLNMAYPDVDGVLTKSGETWKGNAVATGTAGWARWEFDPDDDQSESTLFRRLDMSMGTSGADLNVGTTGMTITQEYSIDTGTFTVAKE